MTINILKVTLVVIALFLVHCSPKYNFSENQLDIASQSSDGNRTANNQNDQSGDSDESGNDSENVGARSPVPPPVVEWFGDDLIQFRTIPNENINSPQKYISGIHSVAVKVVTNQKVKIRIELGGGIRANQMNLMNTTALNYEINSGTEIIYFSLMSNTGNDETSDINVYVDDKFFRKVRARTKPRPAIVCQGGLVGWDANGRQKENASEGVCKAVAPNLREMSSNNELQVDASLSNGKTGRVSMTCHYDTFETDSDGVSIPKSGKLVQVYPAPDGPSVACN